MELKEKLVAKERTIEILRKQIDELKKENIELRKMVGHGISDSRLENLRKNIASLRQEKEKLLAEKEKKDLIKKLGERYEIIYHVGDFENPEEMNDKVILIDSNFSIETIERFGPKAIISEKIPYKKDTNIPMIQKQKINIREINNVLVADKKEIEKAIRESFFVWLSNYKERFHEKA
jgi:soluble P-type ATPase